MPENVRALIVVLTLAVPAFYVGSQLAISVISAREFAVWRNVWFAATVAAFLSGNFYVFAAIEIMICLYANAARAATVAVFVVLLLAIPLIDLPIGGLGFFNYLLDLNNARLLAIVFLLPLLMFATGRSDRHKRIVFSMPDRMILCYALPLIALNVADFAQFARSAAGFSLDVLIPYFAFSRLITNVADLRKVSLAFVIAVLPLSLIGVFESAKGWLLYSSFVFEWRGDVMMRYLLRADLLRANASSAGSIPLGFIIMVAMGCVLAQRQSIGSRIYSRIALAILSAGLIATLSRGPWVGALILVLVYMVTGPMAVANLARFAILGAMALLALLLTPVGSGLFDLLPFVGSVDAGSVTYRQQLFESAIVVIERNPWFGSGDFRLEPEMQKLIQGQHIIDVVNTYLEIALNFGLIGLGLFVSFFATVLVGLWRVRKFQVLQNMGLDAYMRASMATLVAILVTIGTVSSVDYIPYVYWSFAGICVALIRVAYQERATVGGAADAIQVPA